MDAYLLFGHLLRAKLVPESQIHESLFKGANRRFTKVPWAKMAGRQLEQPKSEEAWAKKVNKEQQRRSLRKQKLAAIGYEFEAPSIKPVIAAPVEPAAIEDTAEAPKAIEPAPEGDVEDEVSRTGPQSETPADAVAEESTKIKKSGKKGGKAKGKKSKV